VAKLTPAAKKTQPARDRLHVEGKLMEPNYEKYTVDQLNDVMRVIDREQYPDRYQKIVDLLSNHSEYNASSKSSENIIAIKNPDAKRMYSPLQVYIGSFLGGPIFTVFSLRKNFLAMTDHERALKTLVLGAFLCFVFLVLIPFIPESFPNLILPILYSLLGKFLVERFQLNKAEINASSEYRFESNWKVFALGILLLLVFLAITFTFLIALDYSGLITL